MRFLFVCYVRRLYKELRLLLGILFGILAIGLGIVWLNFRLERFYFSQARLVYKERLPRLLR